jgi:hypothetical protein
MTHAQRRNSALIPVFLVSCAICLLSAGGPSAQAADQISGEWKINANNYPGRIEFSGDRNQHRGRIFIDANNRWESLANVWYDPRNGKIEFDRPEANQHYVGHLLRDGRMEGSFTGDFGWWAERTGDGEWEEEESRKRSISGEWRINANNYPGRIEFAGDRDQYRGRIFIDANNRWEGLANIRFERHSGRIEFDRPEANQHYVGRLVHPGRMEGSFTGDYAWWAERTGDGRWEEEENRKRSMILGEWEINANNYQGRIEFSGDRERHDGRIFMDANNRWESLANIRYDPRSGNIKFDRPEAKQHYVGFWCVPKEWKVLSQRLTRGISHGMLSGGSNGAGSIIPALA